MKVLEEIPISPFEASPPILLPVEIQTEKFLSFVSSRKNKLENQIDHLKEQNFKLIQELE